MVFLCLFTHFLATEDIMDGVYHISQTYFTVSISVLLLPIGSRQLSWCCQGLTQSIAHYDTSRLLHPMFTHKYIMGTQDTMKGKEMVVA